jgi:hypothetical protein
VRPALQPGSGPVAAATYLPSTPDHVLWGRLPCATDEPVLTVEPGTAVTLDTVSHEGILEDQGRDPATFFGRHGVTEVLEDAVALAASAHPHRFGVDGPHVVSRPVAVHGARVGDLLAMTVLDTTPRVPYGVISNRHGKGALAGEHPLGGAPVFSAFAAVSDDGGHGLLPLTPRRTGHRAVPAAAVPGDHGRRRPRVGAAALGAAGAARRQPGHRAADHRQHALPAGPGRRRAGLRR